MIISLIAAVDQQLGMGKNNSLLCHLPADLQHFKSLTLGKPIIMGRNTFESIGKPLPGRKNIILSHHKFTIDGITVVDSLEMALQLTKDDTEVMIIGGGQVYAQAITYANRLFLTTIHHKFDADVFFPNIDEAEWICTQSVKKTRDEKNEYDMTFQTYQRITKAS